MTLIGSLRVFKGVTFTYVYLYLLSTWLWKKITC
jgi:hypothetical protein